MFQLLTKIYSLGTDEELMMNFQTCFINVMAALLMLASLNSLPLRPVPQQQPLPPQQQAQRQLNVSISK